VLKLTLIWEGFFQQSWFAC